MSKNFILTKPPLYLKSFHPELDNLQLVNFKNTLSIYAFFYGSDKQEPFYLLPLLIFSILLAYLHIMGKCLLPTQRSAKSVWGCRWRLWNYSNCTPVSNLLAKTIWINWDFYSYYAMRTTEVSVEKYGNLSSSLYRVLD